MTTRRRKSSRSIARAPSWPRNARLTTNLANEQKAYASVNENLSDAEAWLNGSAAVYDAEFALRPALEADAAGREVSAAQLSELDAKVSVAAQRSGQAWKNVADSQQQKLATLKKNIAEGPARREAARQRAEARAKSEALEKQQQQAQQAGRDANDALHRAYTALAKYDVPDEAMLADVEQKAAVVEGIIPTGGQFYRNEAGLLRLYANLNQPDGAERVKAQLGGNIAAKGEAHGKDFKASVKAAANHCYVFVGEIISWGGQEQIIEPKFESAAQMQEFSIGFANEAMLNDKWKGIEAYGACAVSPGQVSFSGGLKVAGTKNGLRWVVLDFAKNEFPVLLATHLNLRLPDDCDPDLWAAMFLNPVPGTIGYVDAEPVLLTGADPVGGNRDINLVYAGSHKWSNAKKSSVLSAPPKRVSFKHPFEFNKCPGRVDNVWPKAPLSRQIAQCEANIDKKYEGAWAGVDRARDAADRVSTNYVKFYNPAAEEKAGRLREAWDRDWDAQCKPLVAKAEKTLEARFNKLVDTVVDAPPADPIKRAELNASEEDAPYRRW